MHKTRVLITMVCCLFVLAIFAGAQAVRKPGLWEMTTTMSWQKSPMPAGMNMPSGMKSPFSGATTTTQVCLTQEMINKYGAPMSQSNKDCKIINVVMHSTSMTADLVCSGSMNGKGEIESSWPDGNHARGKMHFAGTMRMGQNATPVEWTTNSTSTYKGPDCGSVKPMPMPQN
ncbi:MAG: DUF3617 domain-containing protein [Terracidiphilus sp.]